MSTSINTTISSQRAARAAGLRALPAGARKTTKTISRRAVRPTVEIPPDIGLTTPWTTEERLVHIQALGVRIERHIRFIGTVAKLTGTSAEAKDKAVAIFYDRLLSLEQQLERIQEELELG
jgi:hypothetical protein